MIYLKNSMVEFTALDAKETVQPAGVLVAVGGPTGHVFVADDSNNRIQEFYWKTDVGGTGGAGVNEPAIAVK